MAATERTLDVLENTILARQASPDVKSYTSKLLAGGVEKIGGKILEEAAELVEAAGETKVSATVLNLVNSRFKKHF